MATHTKVMPRRDALRLLEELRDLAFRGQPGKPLCEAEETLDNMRTLLIEAGLGLVPCTGDAHDPEIGGNQDHCALCAPRWGWAGASLRIT